MPIGEQQIALFSSVPKFPNEYFPKDRCLISEKTIDNVCRVLRSGKWSMFTSPEIELFEEEFAELVGAKYSIFVNSCTNAILSSLYALDLPIKPNIIAPAYTYIGTCMPLAFIDAMPIFVDIDPISQSVNTESFEKAVAKHHVDAAILPKLFGKAIDFDEKIINICKKKNISIIYDCAQFLGSNDFTKKYIEAGACCFSFGESKLLRIGEGGAICTNSDKFAERVRTFRHEGEKWIFQNTSRVSGWRPKLRDAVYGLSSVQKGLNCRPLAIAASIGRQKIAEFQNDISKFKTNAGILRAHLSGIDQLSLPSDEVQTWWSFPILINSPYINRDVLLASLIAEGIPAGVHFPKLIPENTIFTSVCKTWDSGLNELFPEASKFSANHIVLPIYPALEKDHIIDIADCLKTLLSNPILNSEEAYLASSKIFDTTTISELCSGLYMFK